MLKHDCRGTVASVVIFVAEEVVWIQWAVREPEMLTVPSDMVTMSSWMWHVGDVGVLPTH